VVIFTIYSKSIGIKGVDGNQLTPLTAVQQRILELLGFSHATYTQLLQ